MSHEGTILLARVALIAILIMATAVARVLVGPSKRRGFYMAFGAFGGMALGVFVAHILSPRIKADISAPCACAGIVVGWVVAWRFVRSIPREAD